MMKQLISRWRAVNIRANAGRYFDGVAHNCCRVSASNHKLAFVVRRTGVFYGVITEMEGQTAEVRDCRRIWYWDGAASLSELADCGPKKPANCKFSVAVSSIVVMGVKEILLCTETALKAIESVRVWRA